MLIEMAFDANFIEHYRSSFSVPLVYPCVTMVSRRSVAEREGKDSTPKEYLLGYFL
jgi:hypothetical protein